MSNASVEEEGQMDVLVLVDDEEEVNEEVREEETVEEEDDDEDLIIDLGHGFESKREIAEADRQETEKERGSDPDAAAAAASELPSSTSPTPPTCANSDVIDLISPEPNKATAVSSQQPASEGERTRKDELAKGERGKYQDITNSKRDALGKRSFLPNESAALKSVVTIDLCSSEEEEEGEGAAWGSTQVQKSQITRSAWTKPNLLDQEKAAKSKAKTKTKTKAKEKKARSESTKATLASKREAEKEARQAKNLAIKRKRGDFALDEVTVLVSTEAIEDTSTCGAGLKICEAVTGKGMKYEVRSNLLANPTGLGFRVPAIFWKTNHFEGKPNALIPCAAIVLQASDFINHLEDGMRFDASFRELLFSGNGLPEHRKKVLKLYCVVIGWDRELETRERKSTTFSPMRYEQKIAELIVNTKGLQIQKVLDAREAAEYLSALSVELARLPYRCDETLGDLSKKVPIIFRGDTRSDQRRAWINCIHQLPQIGVKMAESIAESFDSFGKLMASYTNSLLPISEKRDLVQGLSASDRGRCVGPSLSKKIFEFFTSMDGNAPV